MKNKLFSFINIFGLALSMSICMLVLLRIKDQVGYDKFHPHPSQTYRIISQLTNKQGTNYRFATSPLPLLDKLNTDYNLIQAGTRVFLPGTQTVIYGKKQLDLNGVFTDASFFQVFGFTFKSGNKVNALQEPNTIVLSRDMSHRLFGTLDAFGQTIHFPKWGNFIVSGVLDTQEGKSHLDFDAYISMNSVSGLEKSGKISPVLDEWNNFTNSYSYVVLKGGVREKQLDNAVAAISTALVKTQAKIGKENFLFETQSLNNIVLGEELAYSVGKTGSRGKVLAEMAIGLIILLSACFNYTNLSIARSINRGKEVGIRKVSGALRGHVFAQFILESLMITFLAFGLAYIILQLIIDYAPFISELLPPNFSLDWTLFTWFLLFTLFTGLVAGLLPAWTLSSFVPVQVLKNLSNVKLFGSNNLRKGLIIVQFSISLVIVIFTLIFSKQFDYMANADPGFNRDNILTVTLQGADPVLLTGEFQKVAGVEKISAVSQNLGKDVSGMVGVKRKQADEAIGMDYYDADADFTGIMKLDFLAGNSFPAGATNSSEQYTIINETGLRVLNIKSPGEAIGKQLFLNDTTAVMIVGVVKNFYFRGMENLPGPLLLRNRPENYKLLVVSTAKTDKRIEAAIGAVWKKNYPELEYQSAWLKQTLYERYAALNTASMLGFLAIISITIACLGLLGMVTFLTQTRHKEIGIRKVMGASVAVIISLLSKGFLRMLMIAGCIALPISYLLGYFFLNLFVNRVTIGINILLLSVGGILLLVMITIGAQIYRVAVANPVKSLRSE